MANEAFSEKVSVNINSSTLSSIDLLVDNGYYSNRSDFINQALRSALQQHQSTLDRIIDLNAEHGDPWFIGVYSISCRDVEKSFQKKESYSIHGYGVLIIDDDCPEDQLFAVLQDIKVKGKVVCKTTVKQHYKLK